MAAAIGENEYAVILKDRHKNAKAEWNEVYVDPESGRTRNAEGIIVHSQTSYATPLNFNTFSDENMKQAQDYLAELAANPSSSNTNPDGSPVIYPTRQGRGGFGGGGEGSPEDTSNDFLPYTITNGVISSSWTADGNGNMTLYNAVVPANTTATLYLPINEGLDNMGSVSGAFFVETTLHNNIPVARYELSSGSFDFTIGANGVTVITANYVK